MAVGPVAEAVIRHDARAKFAGGLQQLAIGLRPLFHDQHAVLRQIQQLAKRPVILISARQIACIRIEHHPRRKPQIGKMTDHITHSLDARSIVPPVHHVRPVDQDGALRRRSRSRGRPTAPPENDKARQQARSCQQDQIGHAGRHQCDNHTGSRDEHQTEWHEHARTLPARQTPAKWALGWPPFPAQWLRLCKFHLANLLILCTSGNVPSWDAPNTTDLAA
jgi:hypothetical protein